MSCPGSDTARAIIGRDMEDAALNRPDGAEHVPQASAAARNGDSTPVPRGAGHVDREAHAQTRQAPPTPPTMRDWATGLDEDGDLGMFGPDKPELEDIRAGEDMSAEAWAEGSGEWPPTDPWVRRGLHNLVTRISEELDASVHASSDGMVTVRAGDLDNVLMVAVSALYEADARSGQIEAEAG
jgi:hypothetical protein